MFYENTKRLKMMKIETVNNKEIVISIDHYKYIKKTKISLLLWLILPSIAIILNVRLFSY